MLPSRCCMLTMAILHEFGFVTSDFSGKRALLRIWQKKKLLSTIPLCVAQIVPNCTELSVTCGATYSSLCDKSLWDTLVHRSVLTKMVELVPVSMGHATHVFMLIPTHITEKKMVVCLWFSHFLTCFLQNPIHQTAIPSHIKYISIHKAS